MGELSIMMNELGHTELTKLQLMEIITEADLDKDGRISFLEFKILLKT